MGKTFPLVPSHHKPPSVTTSDKPPWRPHTEHGLETPGLVGREWLQHEEKPDSGGTDHHVCDLRRFAGNPSAFISSSVKHRRGLPGRRL